MQRHFWLALLVTGGCASALTKADRAYDRGDYEQAADMYERLPSREPDVTRRMEEARRRALAKRLDQFETAKVNTDNALAQLSIVLERKLEWPTEAAAFTPRLDAAVQWGSARVAADVDASIASHRPRAANQQLVRRSRYLQSSEFTKLRTDLDGRIHAEAMTRCSALDGELVSPYLRHFASAYCGTFGAPWPETSLPFTIGRFDVDTQVSGLTPAQSERVMAKLNASLRETPWYSASTPEVGRAHVEGQVASVFRDEDVVLTAEYTERVPYSDTESYQEPYQESYLDTEYYTESVPYTAYGTESYSCGTYDHPSTCSRSTSHTEYRSESRTRLVTKTRTAYRTAWRTVTRYRDEDRTYEYNATKHHGRYTSAWRVVLEGHDWPTPLSLQFQRNGNETEIEHDETFEPADLYPSHPTLRSHAQWADKQLDDLTNEVIDTMTNAWTRTFCAQTKFEPEEAARCVYGEGKDAPVIAKDALRRAFGGDEIDFGAPASK